MIRIDERTARCFSNLRAAEFAPLVTYLQALRADKLETLVDVPDAIQVHRLQGAAALLRDLLENIEQGEALLKKLQR